MKKPNQHARNLIEKYHLDPERQPATVALIVFACRPPGLDLATYGNDVPLYRGELRRVSRQLEKFRETLHAAMEEGVTDAQLIAASENTRLDWDTDLPGDWHYTAGQYMPTEYRPAATSLLDRAVHTIRISRPPVTAEIETIEELKELCEQNGIRWFSESNMAFFDSRIESDVIDGQYFISSEATPHGGRKFTVRQFNSEGKISNVGKFMAYDSCEEAIEAIPAKEVA